MQVHAGVVWGGVVMEVGWGELEGVKSELIFIGVWIRIRLGVLIHDMVSGVCLQNVRNAPPIKLSEFSGAWPKVNQSGRNLWWVGPTNLSSICGSMTWVGYSGLEENVLQKNNICVCVCFRYTCDIDKHVKKLVINQTQPVECSHGATGYVVLVAVTGNLCSISWIASNAMFVLLPLKGIL